MRITRIWELKPRQCRFPLSRAPPHFFCADATEDGQSYCEWHRKLCSGGKGKDWQGLAGMMAATEQTIVPVSAFRQPADVQPEIDEVFRSADWIDRPGGLMERT